MTEKKTERKIEKRTEKIKIYNRISSERESYERGITFRMRIVDTCKAVKRQARRSKMKEKAFVDELFALFCSGQESKMREMFTISVKYFPHNSITSASENLVIRLDKKKLFEDLIHDLQENPAKKFDEM